MYGYEAQRYDTVKNFRVGPVEEAFFIKANPLYRPRQPWQKTDAEKGFQYSKASLPKGKYATVEAAMEAYYKLFPPLGKPSPKPSMATQSPYQGRKLGYVH